MSFIGARQSIFLFLIYFTNPKLHNTRFTPKLQEPRILYCVFSFSKSVSTEMPATLIVFTGLVWPEMILIWFFFTPSCFARNSIRHLFALPFSGAAAILTFSIAPNSPAMAVLLLPGTTLTPKTTQPFFSSIFKSDTIEPHCHCERSEAIFKTIFSEIAASAARRPPRNDVPKILSN